MHHSSTCVILLPLLMLSISASGGEAAVKPTHADVAYGPEKRNDLDFWRAKGKGARPLLIYIHGGGWNGGDKRKNLKPQDYAPFLKKGISFASINYRLLSQSPLPAPVHDAARAIQFIRSKAKEWNIDKDRIALKGGSAGACTAMWILLHDDLADPKAKEPLLKESTRVIAAGAKGGQTSIDPRVIKVWVGARVLEHPMIIRAVGEKEREGMLSNYKKHQKLYAEFSPCTHLDKNDQPLFMEYNPDKTLPAINIQKAIHHPVFGLKLKEMSDKRGHECHLLIKGVSKSKEYASMNDFLIKKLLAEKKKKKKRGKSGRR